MADAIPIGDCASLQRGTTYKSKLLGQSGPVLLGLASIARNGGVRTDKLRRYSGESPNKLLVRPGELFVSLKDVTQSADLLGSVARVPPEVEVGRLTQDTVKLVPTGRWDELGGDYIYWCLRTPQYREYCRAHSTGTTNLGLARDDFLAFPLPPPTVNRRATVAALQALDDKIELNRKMNQTLEEMAQAIFKSWFIDFDGHTQFVESELGRIPKGWRVVPFAKAGRWVSGGTPSKKNATYWGGELPWFSAKSLGPLWLTSSGDTVTGLGADAGTRRVPRRTVLFIVRGMSLAKEWRIGMTTGESTLNQDLKGIIDDGTTVPELLLLWLLVHKELIRAKADEAGHGTKRLPTEVLHAHALALPDRTQQERISEPLCAMLQRIENNLTETRTLTELRDTLLPKLISGELRVPEAENGVESVA